MTDGSLHVAKLIPVIFCTLLTTLSLSGCNLSGPEGRRSFSGNVSFDGIDIDGGSIAFESVNSSETSPFRSGAKIQKGTFSVAARDGLPPGEYMVKIYWPHRPEQSESSRAKSSLPPQRSQGSSSDPLGMNDVPVPEGFRRPPAVERIPAKYNTKSDLRATIQAKGKNHFAFDLQSSSQ